MIFKALLMALTSVHHNLSPTLTTLNMAEVRLATLELDRLFSFPLYCIHDVWFENIVWSLNNSCNTVCISVQVSHFPPQATITRLVAGKQIMNWYLNLAKQWADQLSAVGKPIDDDDLISFVVSGLNPLFHTFVIIHSFATRDHDISFADFQAELLNHEILLENQHRPTITPEIAPLPCTPTSRIQTLFLL
jgi:hypothetical protein